ncbi:EscU/YscU/HrcU family type III secretion system export apparatus switch protein [Parvularcula sp. LCG005]|uniref:EscU/YscU/HrcU family type III secretion system export apparatus switch protein n=1 Tax=Parvularcula sp. LCG005 TaxID=3078805 RepID=UPI002942E388|nr:EscU/YscU/HrcU family type III secretion system export apparatus switch protein [Parvularcula sp. LCG005]WOI52673.1 EscU/YscU/HrcU family type III secretion system export apparatus switch protein [Parvularcula sp. LCG005]
MADNDTGADKSYDASPERLKQERKKGNVPQSPELITLARYTGLWIGVIAVAGMLSQEAAERLSGFLINPEASSRFMMNGGKIATMFSPLALAFVGLLLLPIILVVISLIAQNAITFAPNKLKPDIKKLDPIKNAGKKFGPSGLTDFLKSVIKVVVLIAAGFVIARVQLPSLMASVGAPPGLIYGEIGVLLRYVLLVAVILAAVAAAIDTPLRWHRHRKDLRMSRQEMIDETKDIDGDPQQRSMRQAKAREIAQNRQLLDVPKADVIVVNPTHYAVALRWARDNNEVPRCVAKGTDHMAARIREVAEEAKVPIYRDVATARSLYASVDVGEEIQREHYEAVAAAIRFADGLKDKSKR